MPRLICIFIDSNHKFKSYNEQGGAMATFGLHVALLVEATDS